MLREIWHLFGHFRRVALSVLARSRFSRLFGHFRLVAWSVLSRLRLSSNQSMLGAIGRFVAPAWVWLTGFRFVLFCFVGAPFLFPVLSFLLKDPSCLFAL